MSWVEETKKPVEKPRDAEVAGWPSCRPPPAMVVTVKVSHVLACKWTQVLVSKTVVKNSTTQTFIFFAVGHETVTVNFS